jgi:uncharacterized protein (TIGR00297 family)
MCRSVIPEAIVRAVAGLLIAGAIALAGRRARALSSSGAVAATLVGTAAVTAGSGWGALLILYFAASVLLSRVGASSKDQRTRPIVAKSGARDALQVLANGGPFALCALGTLSSEGGAASLAVAAAGALAASAADTWATEIGTLVSGTARSIRGWRIVPAGTSGAMSAAGTTAMAAGALFTALGARTLGLTEALGAVAIAGAAGALADTLIGATLQDRRWCDACGRPTERLVHDCGGVTRHVGGLVRIDNDMVNLLATLTGALVGWLLAFTG